MTTEEKLCLQRWWLSEVGRVTKKVMEQEDKLEKHNKPDPLYDAKIELLQDVYIGIKSEIWKLERLSERTG